MTSEEVERRPRFWQSTVRSKQQIDDALWHQFALLVPSLVKHARQRVVTSVG
jgi:hypothetical protein